MDLELGIVIAIIAAILSPPLTVGVPLAVFQWRQNAALDRRLSNDIKTVKEELSDEIKSVENRLRGEMRTVKEDLSEDIKASENRLRGEIQTVKEGLSEDIKASENRLNHRIDEVEERLNHRIDEVEERLTNRISATDNNVIHLIGEVGLVKGAVLGISAESAPREPVAPN